MTPFAWVTALHWAAVLLYVAAAFLALVGTVFERPRAAGAATLTCLPGLALHGAGLALWWRIVGHGPYMDRFEVLSSNTWMVLAAYLVFARIFPRLRTAAIIIYPACFLMVALALFLRPEMKDLPPTFRSVWLVLHVLFYKTAFASILVAFACSLLFLLRRRGRLSRVRVLSDPEALDVLAYRFTGFGFAFWAIGMAAGSVWAYQSWNSFWSWDPVQTWSLLTWIVFGVYLHLRRFFGWRGARASWLLVACFALAVVSIFVTPFFRTSIHAEYFR